MSSTAIILQARMSSTRRPYKVAAMAGDYPLLHWQIQRLKRSSLEVIVATTENDIDDAVEFIAREAGAKVFRGDNNDVMKRYIDAAEFFSITHIIRVCGDDPLVDPDCINRLSRELQTHKWDFINASHKTGWLLGTSAEAFTLEALKKSYLGATDFEKEHVVLNFRKNPTVYRTLKISPPQVYQETPLTVDFPEDVKTVVGVLNFYKHVNFTQEQLLTDLKQQKFKLYNLKLHEGFLE